MSFPAVRASGLDLELRPGPQPRPRDGVVGPVEAGGLVTEVGHARDGARKTLTSRAMA